MRRLVQSALLAQSLTFVAATLSCSTAFAETSPAAASNTLFTLPGPGAPEPQVTVTRLHQVTPNGGVDFDAKVITVVLYGKKVRFTGGRCAPEGQIRAPNERWAGRSQQKEYIGGHLTIVRRTDTGKTSGAVQIPTEHGPNWQIEFGGEQTGPGDQRSTIVNEMQFLHPTKRARTKPEAESPVAAANRFAEEQRRKFANAVPLITPGPALPANNPFEQSLKKGNPSFVKVHSIVLNNAAFGADAVTAVIDGKEYRFVGSMWPPHMQFWRGFAREANLACQSQAFMTLRKDTNGVVGGSVHLPPNRRLDISTTQSSPPSLASSVQLIEVIEP